MLELTEVINQTGKQVFAELFTQRKKNIPSHQHLLELLLQS